MGRETKKTVSRNLLLDTWLQACVTCLCTSVEWARGIMMTWYGGCDWFRAWLIDTVYLPFQISSRCGAMYLVALQSLSFTLPLRLPKKRPHITVVLSLASSSSPPHTLSSRYWLYLGKETTSAVNMRLLIYFCPHTCHRVHRPKNDLNDTAAFVSSCFKESVGIFFKKIIFFASSVICASVAVKWKRDVKSTKWIHKVTGGGRGFFFFKETNSNTKRTKMSNLNLFLKSVMSSGNERGRRWV